MKVTPQGDRAFKDIIYKLYIYMYIHIGATITPYKSSARKFSDTTF